MHRGVPSHIVDERRVEPLQPVVRTNQTTVKTEFLFPFDADEVLVQCEGEIKVEDPSPCVIGAPGVPDSSQPKQRPPSCPHTWGPSRESIRITELLTSPGLTIPDVHRLYHYPRRP